ncbi:hypothetical protein H4R23_001275 [Coemansia sp. Cherry 401B]|nr:hypothetical protein H4R23_001275 [Coemansia sp. Cherry 401B]
MFPQNSAHMMGSSGQRAVRRGSGQLCGAVFRALVVVCLALQLSGGAYAATKACNQHEELCARAYNDVTYISTHASFAVTSQTKPTKPGTQFKGIKEQLEDGVRGLHLNIMQGASASEVSLCYPDCTVNDGGVLEDTLVTVKTWMDANPNDVVTIFLEGVGTDASPSAVVRAFTDSGIYKYMLPGKPSTWPTLDKMTSDGTTLVVFAEDPNIASANVKGSFIPYAGTVLKLDGPFSYGAEWTCGPWNRTTESIMLIPHFIVQTSTYNGATYNNMPYPFSLGTTNGYQYESHAVVCRGGQSIWINFMEVDFYDQGDVKTPTLKLNALPYDGYNVKDFYPDFFDADPDAPIVSASPPLSASYLLSLAALALAVSHTLRI